MKIFRILLCCLTAAMVLCGCASTSADITPEEIFQAYERAGFIVSSGYYEQTQESGEIGYIQADHPDGDYIYFAIYEDADAAEAAKEEFYHPGVMGLFSWIYGDPSWPRWKVYGNIVIQYDEPEFYEIFQNLLKSK